MKQASFTVDDCKDDLAASLRDRTCVAISQKDGKFYVHKWDKDNVAPVSEYPSAREAAARILQLLHIGPVAPQTWPEMACIGDTDAE